MAELDEFEGDALATILHGEIIKHRQVARARRLCDEITDKQLAWHLRHADFLEGIARKLFPVWTSSP